MSEAEVGCEQALVVEVVDFVPSSLEAADDGGLVLLLQGVGVDRPLRGSAGTLRGLSVAELAYRALRRRKPRRDGDRERGGMVDWAYPNSLPGPYSPSQQKS